ncbi:MAG: hypothetical protein ABSA41_02630 [Terriglobia bacterium]|jgi:hypothetical protein
MLQNGIDGFVGGQPHWSWVTDGTTFINPLGLVFTLLMGLLLLVLPRKYALLPVIALICYMTMGMRIMVGGLNFPMMRILILFGLARVVVRGEYRSIKLNTIDAAVLWWTLAGIVTGTLLWRTSDAFVSRLGQAYNVIGFYFLFRSLLRGMDDINRVVKFIAILLVPLAGLIVVEKFTGQNLFSAFGGVPPVTFVRDGVVRCQGPFAHPILAGTFGATLLPLFIGLWGQGQKSKFIPLMAIIASTTITISSGSSGPVLAYLAGMLGLGMWYLRKHLRTIRWGLLLTIIALHVVMKAPVWFLMARVDVFSGSTGWHRAYLLDRCIANFSDWWLVGTKSTANWAGEEARLFDVTNQYISEAANGGLLMLGLFIMIIVRCFGGIGRAVRASEGSQQRATSWCLWAMGAALFTHVVSFMSVSYFDQSIVNWYLLLAMISTGAGLFIPASAPADAGAPQPEEVAPLAVQSGLDRAGAIRHA